LGGTATKSEEINKKIFKCPKYKANIEIAEDEELAVGHLKS